MARKSLKSWGHGCPQQEGWPAPRWKGVCYVVQCDQSTLSEARRAQGKVGGAGLGQII